MILIKIIRYFAKNNVATAFAATLLASNYSFALPDDSQQKSEIVADYNVFDFKSRTTTFYGSVVFQQGSLIINADKLIYYGKLESDDSETTDKIVATGNPARFQQTPKADMAPVKAIANTLEYSIKAETLFLIDNASLNQDGSSLSGNRIEYDVQKAVVKAQGSTSTKGDDGRVRMVIPPKKLQSQDKQHKTSATDTHPNS